jgi:arylsulfatase A-like enzyme
MKHTARILSAATIAAGLLFCHIQAGAQTRRPNVVLIVADDMGYGDIGPYGSKDIPTPNLDKLAREGVRFTDAYVTGPYCSPTRAGLLTGKYPQRFGHEFNIGAAAEHADVGLPVNETTMADRFRAAGYRTAVFGKWHLGSAPRYHPLERGFDEFFGFLHGQHSYISPTPNPNNPLYDGRKTVTEPAYLTDVLADRAVDFINRNRTQPFLLYLAFNAVHIPLQATDKYLSRFANIKDERRRTYAAMLSAMDDGIGKTLAALDPDNTIIIFFSDNGGPTTVGGVNGSSNAPLKGSKRTTWEGGIRVPFIIKWKGHITAGTTYSQPMIQLDLLPTTLAVAGIKYDPRNFDGVNILPFLTGKRSGRPHETLYWRLGYLMAIRKGDWKLVRMSDEGFHQDPAPLTDLTALELYNLKDDIGEANNLASKQPKKVKELADDWNRWAKGMSKPLWDAPRFPGPGQQPQ